MKRVDQKNLAVVRSLYEAMARGQFPGALLDPEVEYVNPPGAIEPGVRRGLEEFRTSGVELEGRESALLTFRDGKIRRYEWFQGPDEALRAVEAEAAD